MSPTTKQPATKPGLVDQLLSIVHQKEGVHTRELLREPGRFGLGQVPARLKPDTTTDMVCGYCSTGCSLRIHLKDGEAVNPYPTLQKAGC